MYKIKIIGILPTGKPFQYEIKYEMSAGSFLSDIVSGGKIVTYITNKEQILKEIRKDIDKNAGQAVTEALTKGIREELLLKEFEV